MTQPMDHPRIEDERILDRYVVGDLPPEEEALFEEHLFECASCLEHVEQAEALRSGLRDAAVEDAVRGAVAREVAVRGIAARLRSRMARTAAIVAVALARGLLTVTVARQNQELDALAAAIERPPSIPSRFEAPIAGFLTVSLGLVRDLEEGALELRPEPGTPLLLSLELPTVDVETYRVEILAETGEAVWGDAGLAPNLYDSLAVALPAGYLAPGTYRIRVAPESPDRDDAPGGEVRLRILPPA
ncbi:MAG: zf-HC2 domain-containing protein [Holophagales bacterium]|nr:zf-HC2 domain-containing protein [Holophagales bacterium]